MPNASYWKAKEDHPDYQLAKQKIIDCAMEAIAKKGVSKLRFADLADQLGCARPTIYRYFDSKEELLKVAATGLMGEMATQIIADTAKIKDPRRRFAEALYIVINNLITKERYSFLIDPANSLYFAKLGVDEIPNILSDIVATHLIDQESGQSILQPHINII